MNNEKCQICGIKGFKDWKEYNRHHESQHGIRLVKSKPRPLGIDFTDLLAPQRAYTRMLPEVKQAIVEKIETDLRMVAWAQGRLNPLIGTDNYNSEPTWDYDRNVL